MISYRPPEFWFISNPVSSVTDQKNYWILFCRLAMTNTHFFKPQFFVNFVPYGASRSILLKILNFWGRFWGIWIFIYFNGLEDKLHYYNKSCDIFMIVGFHLLCFAPGLLLAGNAKFKSVFFPLEYRFLLEIPGAWISPLLFCCSARRKAFWKKNKLIYFFFSLDLL